MQLLHTYKLKTLCLCVAIFSLISCTKADIHHLEQVSTEALVQIYPDMSAYTLPATAYHFYDIDTKTEYIVRSCDGKGNFEGILPVGTYHVIGTNTKASGVEFCDMHSHKLATVQMPSTTRNSQQLSGTRSEVGEWNGAPGAVYTVVLDTLTVTAGQTTRHEPNPTLLTRTVTITFTLDEKLGGWVTAITGSLYGIYPSVNLFSGCTAEEEVLRSPQISMDYTAQPNTPLLWKAAMQVFGIYNPANGTNYTNTMPVWLTLPGETVLVEINLTNKLSDIIGKHEGNIPVDIPLELEILLEWNGVEIVGSLKPWKEGGTGEGSI